MTTAALADLFTLYRFTPGRRLYALRRTRERLAPNDPLLADIDAAIEVDKKTLELLTRWQTQRRSTDNWPQEALQLDREHDRLWAALQRACHAIAVGYGPDSPQGAAANRILNSVFASGISALIHLPFVEQRERTDAWLARLTGELAADVQAAGLEPIVARLAEVNTRFGQLLDQHKPQGGIAYEQLLQANADGELALLRIVAMLTGRTAKDDAERARLLEPILQQNEQIAHSHRRSAKVPDVDPNTGEVVEPAAGPTT
jgi:hypothetical protein